MGRRVFRDSLIALILLATCQANAAEIELVGTKPANLSVAGRTVRLTGAFSEGDSQKLRTLLVAMAKAPAADVPPQITIEFSSGGGNLYEGLRVGYLIKEFDAATVVRKGDICLSACALAFMGGVTRTANSNQVQCRHVEIGATLGFHSFWLNLDSAHSSVSNDGTRAREQGFTEALAGARAIVRYAGDLKISASFIAEMLAKSPDEFVNINTAEQFLALNICPVGLGRPSLTPEQQALNICGHSTGWAERAAASRVTMMSPQAAKRYMLEKIQTNMSLLKVKGALSSQLALYSVMRNDSAIDNLYADLQAAGVRLPKIVGPVFEVSGYQIGEGETQCFVSLSLEEPDRFEVAVRRPKIWAHPEFSAPLDCRRLFLYDRAAVVNARR